MRAISAILAVTLTFVGIAAVAVFVLGDTGVLVPPPETVAEELLHALQMKRYAQARPHLSDRLRPQVSAEDLRRLWTSIESRTGRVETVTAERGRTAGEAYGILGTRDGSFPVRLRFTLERGEWRLDELNSLEALASRL